MAEFVPNSDSDNFASPLEAETLVVGGGIAGMTAAIDTAELGRKVILVERAPSLGGRVASFFQYFPKMCPPACGLELNFRRMRSNPDIRILTLAEVEKIEGSPGELEVVIRQNPRYVNELCTCCGDCAKVCDIERDNDLNFGIDKTKAIYLPLINAYPPRYVVDPAFAGEEKMKKCVEACGYGAIDLEMQPETIRVKVKGIVWATGWKPYDASRLDQLGYGEFANVTTNVRMERYANESGPTGGKIVRPSDGAEIKRIGFVQCAGSRDENHLPYCSAVCCMASMKQAAYVREQYPEAEIHIFYIDVRSPGRMEDFHSKIQDDKKIFFHRGKVARITETANQNLILEAEDTLISELRKTEVDMAVLATGMVPNSAEEPPSPHTPLDEFGFLAPGDSDGIVGAGVATRPVDVSLAVQDATGAALKAINAGTRS